MRFIQNEDLALRVLARIQAEPEHFAMANWLDGSTDDDSYALDEEDIVRALTDWKSRYEHCETTACFAGHTVIEDGDPDLLLIDIRNGGIDWSRRADEALGWSGPRSRIGTPALFYREQWPRLILDEGGSNVDMITKIIDCLQRGEDPWR